MKIKLPEILPEIGSIDNLASFDIALPDIFPTFVLNGLDSQLATEVDKIKQKRCAIYSGEAEQLFR